MTYPWILIAGMLECWNVGMLECLNARRDKKNRTVLSQLEKTSEHHTYQNCVHAVITLANIVPQSITNSVNT